MLALLSLLQVFSAAKIWFSFDGVQWSKNPIDMKYMPDLSIENARDVIIHLQNRVGMFVRISLAFSNKWMLISEVSFNTQPLDENTTITFELLESRLDTSMPFSANIESDGIYITPTTLIIICVSVFLILGIVVLIALRFQLKRKQSHGHIVVSMKDLATTPLYCEPKDFSSTSSTISNTVADPEYAVPDVAMTLGKMPRPAAMLTDANGHLTNNLSIFGNDMSRMFMVGAFKDQNKGESGYDVASDAVASNVISSDSTSNMVYHLKKAQNINSPTIRNFGGNRMPQHQPPTQQQYYASTDLMAPKMSMKTMEHIKNKPVMTSNTIYTK